jgi:predicted permease
MQTLLQDLRFGLRMLAKNPGFTMVAVLTLALGIGANTTIFSMVAAVLLRPLRYRDSDRLVALFSYREREGRSESPSSPPDYRDWREQSRSFEMMAAAYLWSPVLTGKERPLKLEGLKVTPDLPELLGIAPALGSGFSPSLAPEHEVLLSHGLWLRQFGADPKIVGKALVLNGESFKVVGVMPESFRFPPFWATDAECWVRLDFTSEQLTERNGRMLRVFGRLKPGVSLPAAQSEMDTIAQRLAREYPASDARIGIAVEPLREPTVRGVRRALLVFFGAVVFLLLICCTNVANLLLVRASARQKEFAIRQAMGARRSQLIRQLLTESLLLGLAGGGLGLLLANWGVHFLKILRPYNLPRLEEVTIDSQVLAFTLGISLLASLLFGLVPAWRATSSALHASLKEGGRRTAGSRRGRLGEMLVALEVAVSLVLLVGGGLLLRSFLRLQQLDPGFRTHNLLTLSVSLPGSKYAEPSAQEVFFQRLLDGVRSLPGVKGAGLVMHLPIGGDTWTTRFTLPGQALPQPGEEPRATFRSVSPGYFPTMGIPLLRGRDFGTDDRPNSAPVVIVSRSLARRYLGGEDVVSRQIKPGGPEDNSPALTIVGVAGDTRQWSLTDPVAPALYYPYSQNPTPWFRQTTLVVEGGPEPLRLVPSVEAQVWNLDPNLPVSQVRSMEQILSEAVRAQRFTTFLVGVFAAVALFLALAGIYGVTAYMVGRRTHEIGIRMALGAERYKVTRMILSESLRFVGLGVAAGLIGAVSVTPLLRSLLFGTDPQDPVALSAVVGLLVFVATLACYIPARRATKVDPIVALRYE